MKIQHHLHAYPGLSVIRAVEDGLAPKLLQVFFCRSGFSILQIISHATCNHFFGGVFRPVNLKVILNYIVSNHQEYKKNFIHDMFVLNDATTCFLILSRQWPQLDRSHSFHLRMHLCCVLFFMTLIFC